MSLLLVRSALWSATLLILCYAALQDLRARIIPNRLVVSVAAIGLLLGALTRPHSLWINLVVTPLLLLALGVLSHYDVLGAGDAKLMTGVTLLVPPDHILFLLFAITLFGGAVSAAYLAVYHLLKRRGPPAPVYGRRSAFMRWLHNERARIVHGRSVPYALAIAGGTASYVISELTQCLSATFCSL